VIVISSFYGRPNLSRHRLDVCQTSTHGVALVRIYNAGLKCTAHGLLKNAGCKKSPSGHHRTTLSGYIFPNKARIDNGKRTCQAAISPPHVPAIWWTSAY